jgi:hypothetical protein
VSAQPRRPLSSPTSSTSPNSTPDMVRQLFRATPKTLARGEHQMPIAAGTLPKTQAACNCVVADHRQQQALVLWCVGLYISGWQSADLALESAVCASNRVTSRVSQAAGSSGSPGSATVSSITTGRSLALEQAVALQQQITNKPHAGR